MLSKAKIEGNFLNLIKVSRKHIIVNDERLNEGLLSKVRNKTRILTGSPHLFTGYHSSSQCKKARKKKQVSRKERKNSNSIICRIHDCLCIKYDKIYKSDTRINK